MNKLITIVLFSALLIVSLALVGCQPEANIIDLPCVHSEYESFVVESTCTEKGYTLHTCLACGIEYRDNYTEEHNYTDNVVPATCDKEGYTERTCQDCGKYIRVNITPKDPTRHNVFAITGSVAPTCTEFGYNIATCVDCGYQYNTDYVAPAHNFGGWQLSAPVSCGEYGIDYNVCVNCGAYEERLNSNPAHIEKNVTVFPSTGKMTYYCDCGDYSHTTDEYKDVLEFELKKNADGTEYYVVKGFKSGISAEDKKYVYIPVTVNHILVTEIAPNAFMNDNNLEEIHVAFSVTKIGAYAFAGCTNLKTITYDAKMAKWNEIQKAAGWNYQCGLYVILCKDGVIAK